MRRKLHHFLYGSDSRGALRSGFGLGICRSYWDLGKGDRTACECKRRESKINKFRYFFHMFFQWSERAIRSRVTLRKEGQVELRGRRPNDLALPDAAVLAGSVSIQICRRFLAGAHGQMTVSVLASTSCRAGRHREWDVGTNYRSFSTCDGKAANVLNC